MGFKPNQKNNNNFFTKMIQRYGGDDFLSRINARDIQNSAINLFRDIARGKVDMDKHGHYFLDNQFTDNLLIQANSQHTFHSINFTALNWFIMSNPTQISEDSIGVFKGVLEKNRLSYQAYECIIKNLCAVKSTRDLNYLYILTNNLRNFRNNI